jgi:1-phosphatidylinositol-4-phosphate 5-kinase
MTEEEQRTTSSIADVTKRQDDNMMTETMMTSAAASTASSSSRFEAGMISLKAPGSWKSTEESSDKASSAFSDGIYEVIEYDLDAEQDNNTEYCLKAGEITIHKDSPAAAALRANAEVKVPAYSKAARAVHMQTVRRALKRARGGGNRKGKPPRAPPPNTLLPLPPLSHTIAGGGDPASSSLQTLEEEMDSLSYQQRQHQLYHTNIPPDLQLRSLDESDAISEEEEDENDDDTGGENDDNDEEEHENDAAVAENKNQDRSVLEGAQHDDEKPAVVAPASYTSDTDDDKHAARPAEAAATPPRKKDYMEEHGVEERQHQPELATTYNHGSPLQKYNRDTMHFPMENITPGTVEAGKKGTFRFYLFIQMCVGIEHKKKKKLTLILVLSVKPRRQQQLVLGSVDPHDLLRLVRWRGKRPKKNKSYVKGKVIDGEHELYTLSIAVMIGVRTSISRTNTELNKGPTQRFVNGQDFRATEKYEFRPKGGGPLPPHQLAHTFKFKDYSPMVFAYLRRMHGVNEFDFLLSVCGNANFIEFISNAKSGQFFFYSSDGRYMIKTMTNTESKFLRRILPQYFKHCCENPNTMFTRFFGMYRVKLYHLRRNVKFVIMNSVYHTDKLLQTFYDLKGSIIGRDAKPGQAVLKDNDLRRQLPDGAFALRPKQREEVEGQLQRDMAFLESIGIMDYSMLVGIHHIPAFGDRNNAATLSFRRKRRTTLSDESCTESSDNMVDVVPKSPVRQKRPSDFASEIDELEDDDNSYLEGTDAHQAKQDSTFNSDTEQKKQTTIERLFWPYHHLYDIHGHRRWRPYESNEHCDDECSSTPSTTKKIKSINGCRIPDFVKPLSERKDGGFEMDTTGLQLPLKLPDGTLYEGKIFYMGIIDILQEYNTRKAIESKYRYFRSPQPNAASCVPPDEYAKRFIDFFDEYTKRDMACSDDAHYEMGVEISERTV